jgi:hypothetical protein
MLTVYQSNSIAVVDEHGVNLRITRVHTPLDQITIQRGDRRDLLYCLMQAEGIEDDVIRLLFPEHPR